MSQFSLEAICQLRHYYNTVSKFWSYSYFLSEKEPTGVPKVFGQLAGLVLVFPPDLS